MLRLLLGGSLGLRSCLLQDRQPWSSGSCASGPGSPSEVVTVQERNVTGRGGELGPALELVHWCPGSPHSPSDLPTAALTASVKSVSQKHANACSPAL